MQLLVAPCDQAELLQKCFSFQLLFLLCMHAWCLTQTSFVCWVQMERHDMAFLYMHAVGVVHVPDMLVLNNSQGVKVC
jgi:hypothetical protein